VDVRDVSIISQVAAKEASALLQVHLKLTEGQIEGDGERALFNQYYDLIRDRVLADVLAAEGERQFPGAKVEEAAQSGLATLFTPNAGPAPVPGAGSSDVDLQWRDYFRNPGDYWDNRQNKTNPNGPDFKKKVGKFAGPEEKRNAPALWIDRKDTPTWVLDQLGKF
jgi:hypothetical protein